MKLAKISKAFLLVIAGSGLPLSGNSQTYYYSGPVSGYTEVALNPGAGYAGGFVANFGNLTETLYYDPVAGTLRQVGTVTVSPASGAFNMVNIFTRAVVGSASLTVGTGENISFDATFTGDAASGSLFSDTGLVVPISGWSSPWNIRLPLTAEIISATPTSLTFSEGPGFGSQFGSVVGFGAYSNGQFGLYWNGTGGDNSIHYSWQLNSVVATAVPEPGLLSIFGFGFSALAFLRRR
jgi:hypothetical protein